MYTRLYTRFDVLCEDLSREVFNAHTKMTEIKTNFTCRDECADFCRKHFELRLSYPLIFRRGKYFNEFRFAFECQSCHVLVVSAKRSRSVKKNDTFSYIDHHVETPHRIEENAPWCYPSIMGNKKKSTIQELTQSDVLNIAVNDVSSVKGRNRGLSTQAKKTFCQIPGMVMFQTAPSNMQQLC